jgi:ribosome maturation factor RimP
MGPEEKIKKLAEQKLSDPRHFIVDVIISAMKGPRKILVILDGDDGVNIEDCAAISRALSKELDESPIFDDPYTLDVSSPGLDQPLKLQRQFVKNIGRRLKVKLADKIEEGKLEAVTGEAITLARETGTGKKKELTSIDINFSQIERAFVLVSFK